jgi:Thioredoxin domain-containing protein
MSKFGDLIDLEVPVLFNFYAEWNDASLSMTPVLKDVAAALGDKAKVIKIDVDKTKNFLRRYALRDCPP